MADDSIRGGVRRAQPHPTVSRAAHQR